MKFIAKGGFLWTQTLYNANTWKYMYNKLKFKFKDSIPEFMSTHTENIKKIILINTHTKLQVNIVSFSYGDAETADICQQHKKHTELSTKQIILY